MAAAFLLRLRKNGASKRSDSRARDTQFRSRHIEASNQHVAARHSDITGSSPDLSVAVDRFGDRAKRYLKDPHLDLGVIGVD